MAKRLSILLMTALLVLSGCGSPSRQTEDFFSSGSEETCFLEAVSTDERESQQESIPDSVIKVLDNKETAENDGSSVKVNDTVNDEVNDSVTAEDEQMLYQAEIPEQKESLKTAWLPLRPATKTAASHLRVIFRSIPSFM